ncbi:hypothetical protein HB779_23545 (plasmid) [Phyllobacterium sp. 628]|uniref:hypothetical protein n=1 Tax=Phyllobacterium sp. 628 TaxID=2718938 RepID=UPI001662306C|nr:hypothetical protein [Phyllobacterium sp. 628]QND54866.1 hypothetical protein HB779_23545 [Phyllobacterium sp. 628]
MGLMNATTPPEDVFIAWLMHQPRNADLVAAASAEVARLQRHAQSHPGARRLHELFCALINAKEASLRPQSSQSCQ